MPAIPDESILGLLSAAATKLSLNNKDLGKFVGLSPRTISRWWSREATPAGDEVVKIVRAVYPKDSVLAAKLALEVGTTVQLLGLFVPPPPVAPPPLRPRPPNALMVESIVCAAAVAQQATPDAVRPILQAAFARARGMGLSVEEVDDALSPVPAKQAAGSRVKSPKG
jgi:hypothetical protein